MSDTNSNCMYIQPVIESEIVKIITLFNTRKSVVDTDIPIKFQNGVPIRPKIP